MELWPGNERTGFRHCQYWYCGQVHVPKPKPSLLVELLPMPASPYPCPDLLVSTLHCSPSSHFFSLHVSFLLLEFNSTLSLCRTSAQFLKALSVAGEPKQRCHLGHPTHLPCAVPSQPGATPCETRPGMASPALPPEFWNALLLGSFGMFCFWDLFGFSA